jgi:phage shock protein C
MEKKLHRIPDQAVLGGVASGIANYLQIDVVIVRVLFVVMLLLPLPPSFGWTGLIYIILWAVLPTGPASQTPSGVSFDFTSPTQSGEKKGNDQTVMIIGGALVLFGALMLMNEFPIWYQFKRYFWPIVLIGVGAFLILRQRDKANEEKTTAFPSTPPPADPDPVTPVDPDPQPYTPFSTPANPSHFPEDPENKTPEEDDDRPIKVN